MFPHGLKRRGDCSPILTSSQSSANALGSSAADRGVGRLARKIEELGLQCDFSVGECITTVKAIGSIGATAPIELPAAEPATAARRIPWRCKAPGIPSQYGPHARQKLAYAERRGDAVIGAKLEPDLPVDLVASLIVDDDHRGHRGATGCRE